MSGSTVVIIVQNRSSSPLSDEQNERLKDLADEVAKVVDDDDNDDD